jgi:hypothetical protein
MCIEAKNVAAKPSFTLLNSGSLPFCFDAVPMGLGFPYLSSFLRLVCYRDFFLQGK